MVHHNTIQTFIYLQHQVNTKTGLRRYLLRATMKKPNISIITYTPNIVSHGSSISHQTKQVSLLCNLKNVELISSYQSRSQASQSQEAHRMMEKATGNLFDHLKMGQPPLSSCNLHVRISSFSCNLITLEVSACQREPRSSAQARCTGNQAPHLQGVGLYSAKESTSNVKGNLAKGTTTKCYGQNQIGELAILV